MCAKERETSENLIYDYTFFTGRSLRKHNIENNIGKIKYTKIQNNIGNIISKRGEKDVVCHGFLLVKIYGDPQTCYLRGAVNSPEEEVKFVARESLQTIKSSQKSNEFGCMVTSQEINRERTIRKEGEKNILCPRDIIERSLLRLRIYIIDNKCIEYIA